MFQATAKASEGDASSRKKSHELSINAGQGDLSDKEKTNGQPTVSNKLTANEIHSEIINKNAPNAGLVTSVTDSEKTGNPLEAVSENLSIENENNPANAMSELMVEKVTDIDKIENVNRQELKMGSDDEKYSNKTNTLKAPSNQAVPDTQKVPSPQSKENTFLSSTTMVNATPNSHKINTLDCEQISPTPFPESIGLVNSNTASSFASASQSKASKGE